MKFQKLEFYEKSFKHREILNKSYKLIILTTLVVLVSIETNFKSGVRIATQSTEFNSLEIELYIKKKKKKKNKKK